MTRRRYFSTAMPLAAVLYAIALIVTHGNAAVALVGALLFAVVAFAGTTFGGRRSV